MSHLLLTELRNFMRLPKAKLTRGTRKGPSGMPTFKGKQKNSQIEKELFREVRGEPWESIIREPKEKECFKNII